MVGASVPLVLLFLEEEAMAEAMAAAIEVDTAAIEAVESGSLSPCRYLDLEGEGFLVS